MNDARHKANSETQMGNESAAPTGWIIAILALALGLRLLVWVISPHSDQPSEDSKQYHNIALSFLKAGVLSTQSGPPYVPSGRRVPGYPLFLAMIYGVIGIDVYGVKLLQCLFIGPAGVYLTYVVATQLGATRKWALIAMTTAAVSPILVGMCDSLAPESLFTLLLLLSTLTVLQWYGSREYRWVVLTGVLWGCLALTKPESALLPMLVVPGLLLATDRQRRSVILFQSVLAMMIVGAFVGGWLWRNYQVMGRPSMLVSTVEEAGGVKGGFLRKYRLRYENGFTFRPSRFSYLYGEDTKEAEKRFFAALHKQVADPDESDVKFWLKRPHVFAKYCLIRAVGLLQPHSASGTFGLSRGFGEYLEDRNYLALTAKSFLLLLNATILLVGLWGVITCLCPAHSPAFVVASIILYFLAAYVLIHGIGRYRVPLMPLMFAAAAYSLTKRRCQSTTSNNDHCSAVHDTKDPE